MVGLLIRLSILLLFVWVFLLLRVLLLVTPRCASAAGVRLRTDSHHAVRARVVAVGTLVTAIWNVGTLAVRSSHLAVLAVLLLVGALTVVPSRLVGSTLVPAFRLDCASPMPIRDLVMVAFCGLGFACAMIPVLIVVARLGLVVTVAVATTFLVRPAHLLTVGATVARGFATRLLQHASTADQILTGSTY